MNTTGECWARHVELRQLSKVASGCGSSPGCHIVGWDIICRLHSEMASSGVGKSFTPGEGACLA